MNLISQGLKSGKSGNHKINGEMRVLKTGRSFAEQLNLSFDGSAGERDSGLIVNVSRCPGHVILNG